MEEGSSLLMDCLPTTLMPLLRLEMFGVQDCLVSADCRVRAVAGLIVGWGEREPGQA